MVTQRAGQKRKVIEVPNPHAADDSEDSFANDLSSLDDEGASGSAVESEAFDEEEDSVEEQADNDELDSDEIPSSGPADESEANTRHVNGVSTRKPRLKSRNGATNETTADLDADEDDNPNYVVEEDANGNLRYLYKEIDAQYDSDDSAPETANTIGDIPLSYYDAYPHIGYDINGKKISRPAKGEALDALLDSIDLPEGWTGLTDPATGKPLQLSKEELDVLKQISRNEAPGDGYDPYPDMVEYFTGREEIMPLSAAPEPKRRFVPSMHEHKRVMKMVKAIKEGRIKPWREDRENERQEDDEDELNHASFDIWADEAPRPEHSMNLPAPKLPPPGYEESYHPPPEYLPDEEEERNYNEQDEEDRDRAFLPRDHTALRRVPGYEHFIKERFERSMDLYMAPRIRRSKLNIDPESLLPRLPDPAELRPFPDHVATMYKGHEGRVRDVAIDPSGACIASGGDDGTVRLWDLQTGYCLQRLRLSDSEAVHVVSWRPGPVSGILAICCGESIHFAVPDLPNMVPSGENAAVELVNAGFAISATNASKADKPGSATWHKPVSKLAAAGIVLSIALKTTPRTLVWHRKGDYFSTVSPSSSSKSTAIAIHTLSKHLTQYPFKRLRGLAQTAAFHPSKPLFFAATRQRIRVYDLQQQKLEKELLPGVRWISAISLHPLGSNLLISSFDKRLLWHDLDMANTPYKTLRYHTKAIRDVKFHPLLPLFADASDDGSLQVFHGRVTMDEMENATIVPLKVLKGHKIVHELGVLALTWHPREAWCVSAGADGTIRLWT